MVARLAEEEVSVGSKPAQHIGEKVLHFDVLEVHQQPVGEHHVITTFTQCICYVHTVS